MDEFGNVILVLDLNVYFFFSSRRRHTSCSRDWSSDVCSSDLVRELLRQMVKVGFNSIPVVLMTAMFTGMVMALQMFTVLRRINAESFVGSGVSLSMVRELAPVLSGLIVAGRAGSAMGAELGTMRVTEQIDALEVMATDPVHYLVVPRVWASTIMLPLLVVMANGVGILGGY